MKKFLTWFFGRGIRSVANIGSYAIAGLLMYGYFKESPEYPSFDFNMYLLGGFVLLGFVIGLIVHTIMEYNARNRN